MNCLLSTVQRYNSTIRLGVIKHSDKFIQVNYVCLKQVAGHRLLECYNKQM